VSDIRVEDHGTVALLRALSEAGDDFLRNQCSAEPWQWLGGSVLAVEPRLVPDLVGAAREAGLDVDLPTYQYYDPGATAKQWNDMLRRRQRLPRDARLN
jgi:hypothetical protein